MKLVKWLVCCLQSSEARQLRKSGKGQVVAYGPDSRKDPLRLSSQAVAIKKRSKAMIGEGTAHTGEFVRRKAIVLTHF